MKEHAPAAAPGQGGGSLRAHERASEAARALFVLDKKRRRGTERRERKVL